MQIPYILLQTILIPIIAAIVCALLGKQLKKKVGWIASAAMIYVTALLAYVGIQIWTQGGVFTESYSLGYSCFRFKIRFSRRRLKPARCINPKFSLHSSHRLLNPLHGPQNRNRLWQRQTQHVLPVLRILLADSNGLNRRCIIH